MALPARAAASAGTAGSASGSVGLEAELRALLAREQKIEAIKRYREASGSSLRVAKDAVEALEAGRGLPSPADVARTEAGPSERPSAGCVLLLLVLVAGAALAVAMAS